MHIQWGHICWNQVSWDSRAAMMSRWSFAGCQGSCCAYCTCVSHQWKTQEVLAMDLVCANAKHERIISMSPFQHKQTVENKMIKCCNYCAQEQRLSGSTWAAQCQVSLYSVFVQDACVPRSLYGFTAPLLWASQKKHTSLLCHPRWSNCQQDLCQTRSPRSSVTRKRLPSSHKGCPLGSFPM